MKKRKILSKLLVVCMLLTFLPMMTCAGTRNEHSKAGVGTYRGGYTTKYDYSNVVESDDVRETIYTDTDITFDSSRLGEGYTKVFPIKIIKAGNYRFQFSDYTWGSLAFLVQRQDGKVIYEKGLRLEFNSWTKKLHLSKGKYKIKVLSREDIGLQFKLELRPMRYRATYEMKMSSCNVKKLEGLGKGKWTTSNSKVVSIITKKSGRATCNVRGKRRGKATVTFRNKDGAKIKYKITVWEGKTYPVDDATFYMNSAGGLEPWIRISNNSAKKIKYVYLTVSFYNRVGDRVTNDIGGYKKAELEITGPIKPWHWEAFEWNPVFYSNTASKMKIEKITVKYFGGTTKTKKINRKYKISYED